MILDLQKSDSPILRKKAKPVKDFGDPMIRQLVEDMKETMRHASGLGLAAPQVGTSKRILIADCGPELGGFYALINPKILHQEGTQLGLEGCLSFPNLYGDVERAAKVTVKAQDLNGRWFKVEAEGLLSRCFQHEVDHLNGILFIDKAQNLREIQPEEFKREFRESEAVLS